MTKFVGILNLTPDSFFDGGKYNESSTALKQLENLIADGFDVIDVGGQSTRPNALVLSDEEEWERLEILPEIIKVAHKNNVLVSLDSYHSKNIARALDLGIDIINDVSGFSDKNMIDLAAVSGKKIVLMHNLGVPADKNKIIDEKQDVVEVLISWAQNKIKELKNSGIKKEQIIFDPGIGFGKNASQSIKIIQEIDKFKILDLPLYIGHSNKSFLDSWQIDNCQTREEKTAFITKYLIEKNIDYIRLHKKCW